MKISRRNLLKSATAVACTATFIPSTVFGNEDKPAPSERITVGHIGVGNEGGMLFRVTQGIKEAQSVATSDCYKSRREGCAAACKGKAFLDYREIIDNKDIDCIVIATPDHWHVPQCVAAAKAKKSVYCEKPLGLTMSQVLQIEKVFADNGVQFQYGTQQRSQQHNWYGCALVREGAIGKVVKIEVDAPDGHGGGNQTVVPIPEDLGEAGYEMWNGPTLLRPYTPDRCKPNGTYMIYDYSIGYLAGWGAHPLDLMVWGSEADVSGTVEVKCTGTIKYDDLCNTVHRWIANIKLGEVELLFKTGGDRTRFIGENGDWIQVRRGGIEASKPELLTIPVKEPAQDLKGNPYFLQLRDLYLAHKDGGKTITKSNLRDAVRSDVISHLCDISVRTDSVVKWNPKERVLIDPTVAQKEIMNRR